MVTSGPASPAAKVEAFAAGEIEEHLVDARDLRDGRVPLGDATHARRVVAVEAVARRQVHGLRRELEGALERHARAHAERANLVARRRDDAALPGTPADDHGLSDQARIEQPLDRHEERVQVQAADARRRESHLMRIVSLS